MAHTALRALRKDRHRDMAMPAILPCLPPRLLGPHRFVSSARLAPARYNFVQAATYRLKFSGIPGREGLVVYPSLHVYPTLPQTAAYLEHNALPLRVTDEDLDQIETNNFVTKVIYLPDAKFQELAIAGVEELVSTRLGPGCRSGSPWNDYGSPANGQHGSRNARPAWR